MTATEIRVREKKTLKTRDKKVLYWRPAVRDILYGWLAVKATVFGDATVTPERPQVEFPAVIDADPLELAQTASALAAADAASKETLVRIVHPDWSQEQVDTEVRMIYAETGLAVAGRARITLAPPMNSDMSIQQEVQQLADASEAPSAAQLPETGDVTDD